MRRQRTGSREDLQRRRPPPGIPRPVRFGGHTEHRRERRLRLAQRDPAVTHDRQGRIVTSRTYTIRPPTPQFSFTGIHGVRWEDVRDAPTFGDLWQRYAGGSTTWNSWPPTTRRSIGVSSSRVARDTGCVRREHHSLVPSSLLAHNGEFTRRRCQTSADSFVFCSITTTPGRTRKRARASYSPPRPQATREDGHPRRDGRRLWRLASPVGARRTNSAAYQ